MRKVRRLRTYLKRLMSARRAQSQFLPWSGAKTTPGSGRWSVNHRFIAGEHPVVAVVALERWSKEQVLGESERVLAAIVLEAM